MSHDADVGKHNTEFLAFRLSYLTAFLCGTSADWVKGPYIYRLYETRGFTPDEITILFVAGYASSAVFGVVAGIAADAFGRRKMCLFFCAIYILHGVMHISHSFSVLLAARAISGVATALLFSAFEAWMVTEHHAKFAECDLSRTFSIQTQFNSIAAMFAGFIAQAVVHVGGYASPFALAVPLLCSCAWQVRGWPENYGPPSGEIGVVIHTTFNSLNSRVIRVGIMQSLFEGSMHIFVFLWTPCLQRGGFSIPHGIIFAVYMICMMAGGQICRTKYRPPLGGVFLIAAICLSIPFITDSFVPSLLAFCGFEWCCGCYFPQIAMLRSEHFDAKARNALITLFRLPLNVIVVGALLWGRTFPAPLTLMFASGALALSAVLAFTFPQSEVKQTGCKTD